METRHDRRPASHHSLPRGRGEAEVNVTSVRVAGMVHDFLLLGSLRNTKAANVARGLAIKALKEAVQ
jgi:hypothetical protein